MIGSGLNSGDLLIVDRALEPTDNSVVIAVVNGEGCCSQDWFRLIKSR